MFVLLLLNAPAIQAQSNVEPALDPKDQAHWAFRKPAAAAIPQPVQSGWVRTPIDAFILAQLEAKKIPPSAAAAPLTLLRRATFDLTGLPPSPEEIADFLADRRVGDPYERVVDRLLASPHYGERWAQHWLDVVRYAESNGYEGDRDRPSSWRYRDYVVRSFQEDKPFDRFLTEQIAGDELAAGKDPRGNSDLWIATGLHRCGPNHVISGNVDLEVLRQEVLTEMVQGVGSAFLGLTVNCARCHDHKFDPISQADYYRLEAFFAATQMKDVDYSTPEEKEKFQKALLDVMAKAAKIKAQVADLDLPYHKKAAELKRAKLPEAVRLAFDTPASKRTPEQQRLAKDAQPLLKVSWDEALAVMTPADREKRADLRAKQHAIEAELPYPPSQAWAVADDGKPVPTYILKRGDVKRKTAAVEPGFLRVLQTVPGQPNQPRTAISMVVGGMARPGERRTRADLARWLTDGDHPLTARVFVNRLWQHHFGRGLVATPNDFGTRGERPTHPELLDFLALEFMRKGWKIKDMHRMMVLSNTYRQSSSTLKAPDHPGKIQDPDNKLLWRMNRNRLDAETIRDAVLASAGALNRRIGGPMVRVPLEPEVYDLIFTEGEPDGLWPTTPDPCQHDRRTLYLFAKRNVRLPLLEAFDQPDRLTPCAGRPASTFAPQALILMNGPFTQEQSRRMAATLFSECGADRDRQIERAYLRAFGRPATLEERATAKDYLTDQTESYLDRLRMRLPVALPEGAKKGDDPAELAALADYCLALMNANEFLYVR